MTARQTAADKAAEDKAAADAKAAEAKKAEDTKDGDDNDGVETVETFDPNSNSIEEVPLGIAEPELPLRPTARGADGIDRVLPAHDRSMAVSAARRQARRRGRNFSRNRPDATSLNHQYAIRRVVMRRR